MLNPKTTELLMNPKTTESMDSAFKATIEAIHASPTKAVLHLAGGASQSLGWLLSVPRASQTILEATIPYARASMVQLLGKVPQHYVNKDAADEIAMAGYNRALSLALPGSPVAGIGFTGALASATPKRGEHRCHISCRTHSTLRRYDLTLSKGFRDRFGEDRVSSQLLIKALADVCGIGVSLPVELKSPEEVISEFKTEYTEDEELEQLLRGDICMVRYDSRDSQGKIDGRRVVLSGAYNPLHEGHMKLMDTACSLVDDGIPCFELSAVNADKPPLTVDDIKQRVKQFCDNARTLAVTNQPFFYKKAEIFPGSTFVVGIDTAMRLVNARYYGGDRQRMMEVLGNVQSLDCDFIVAGRRVGDVFRTMSDVEIPPELQSMFRALPEEVFRIDLSSTELRAQRK